DSGHYHSNWLSMIYPRLFLARNLLRNDGVIFVSIDDNEVHNLRMVMNEIFGEENFVAQIIWQKKYSASNDAKGVAAMHDYVIAFQKSENFKRNLFPRTEEANARYNHDDNDGRGPWKSSDLLVKSYSESYVFPILNSNTNESHLPAKGSCWRANKETIARWIGENRIYFGKDGKGAPQLKRYLAEVQQGIVPTTWWDFEFAGHNDEASRELKGLFDGWMPFDTPKPTKLITRLLQLGSGKDSLVLDFFAGSGTTAHAVMELNAEDDGNRCCISVQLPEAVDEDSEAYKAGYKTIADISRERIRRAGQKIREANPDKDIDTGFHAFRLSPSCFKQWQTTTYSAEELEQQMIDFIDTNLPEADDEDRLFELLIKSGYDPHVAIDKRDGYYSIAGGVLIVVLGAIDQTISRKILSEKPTKVISLDTSFGGNDVLKTNILIEAEGMGVEWKVI
ncbi:MAG: site-specific DNA-methyltransferase, partial [Candidatus Gracilibacteria bacterium]|nr:site-specific DNA-methyltransferase [Candidatus Gracilibacteria bacterium]